MGMFISGLELESLIRRPGFNSDFLVRISGIPLDGKGPHQLASYHFVNGVTAVWERDGGPHGVAGRNPYVAYEIELHLMAHTKGHMGRCEWRDAFS